MLFDWFTFVAQIVNFLILVFLLWRFLYKPITKTTRKRQEMLEKRWQEAHERQEEAKQEAESYRQKQQELEEQRQELLDQARENAAQKRQELVKQARQEVEEKQQNWEEAIAQEQESFLSNLRSKVAGQTYAIARRALQDLADADLEQQATNVFIERLQKLPDQERQDLSQSVAKSDQKLTVRSSFDLSQEMRQKIQETLQEQQIANHKSVNFTTVPELICGIELRASDYELAWSIEDYLQNLEASFSQEFQKEHREQPEFEEENEQSSSTTANNSG